MIETIQSIFGAYEPLIGEGIASVNWEWISGVVLFSIVLVGFFRVVSILLNKR